MQGVSCSVSSLCHKSPATWQAPRIRRLKRLHYVDTVLETRTNEGCMNYLSCCSQPRVQSWEAYADIW